MMARVLDFDSFVGVVVEELELDVGVPIVASTHLFEDLDFDSFLMIELVALVEHLADVREPPDELPVVETVGQCYELYLRAVGQSAAGKEEPGALR